MRVPHRIPAIVSPEEVERLLGALGSLRMQAIIMTAYGTGLRVSEVLNLRVEDIDSRRMVIHVRHGKRNRDRQLDRPRDHSRSHNDSLCQTSHLGWISEINGIVWMT
jgi:integrase